jgi:hypothetical protein
MSRQAWLIWILIAATLGGGMARLTYEGHGAAGISDIAASRIANCLPARQIGKDSPVALASLGRPEVPAPLPFTPTNELDFELTQDTPLDPVNADVQAQLQAPKPAVLRPGTRIRVRGGSFTLQGGSVAVRQADGAWLLGSADPLRFAAVPDTEYVVRLKTRTMVAPAADGTRTLKKGTRGTLVLPDGRHSAGIVLQPLQPFLAQPWLSGVSRNISPVRSSGQKGFSDLAIDVRKVGLQFDAAGTSFAGCAWSSGQTQPYAAAVPAVKPGGAGAATITLAAPPEVLPAFAWPMVDLVRVAVATADGRYVGFGAFAALDRGWAALIALAWLSLWLGVLLSLRNTQLKRRGQGHESQWGAWAAGLFLGPDGQPSLSLFQIFFWTVITLWGLAYVFLVTGSLASLTPSMMVLVGIAGVGTVAARFVSRPAVDAPATAAAELDFSAMLSTSGHFDLLKLQLLLFTLMIGLYVVWRLADMGVFPELDSSTLLLLGVSQGIYVGGKVASTTPLAEAQAAKLELEAKRAALKVLTDEKATLAAGSPRLAAIAAEEAALTAEIPKLEAKLDSALKALGLTG